MLKFSSVTSKTIPKAELMPLIRAAQAGDVAARNRVVESTFLLVSRQVTRWVQHFACPELEDDMFQAAVAGNGRNSGLITAVMKFDTHSGYAWTTYAMHYINAEIRSVFTESCGRALGRAVSVRVARLRRAHDALEATLGRPPTVEEIQADFRSRGKPAPSPTQIELAIAGRVDVGGFGVEGSHGGEDETIAAIDEARQAQEFRAAVAELPAEERATVEGRLAGKTFTQLGQECSRGRERMRQREASALERLRAELL